MKAISTRIRKLEVGAGFIETEESRRTRELVETIRRRRAARRAREGLPAEEPDEDDLSGLTLTDILHRGRARARARTLAGEERTQQAAPAGGPPVPSV
jgi:hypothetical protein